MHSVPTEARRGRVTGRCEQQTLLLSQLPSPCSNPDLPEGNGLAPAPLAQGDPSDSSPNRWVSLPSLTGADPEETILNAFKVFDPEGKGSLKAD